VKGFRISQAANSNHSQCLLLVNNNYQRIGRSPSLVQLRHWWRDERKILRYGCQLADWQCLVMSMNISWMQLLQHRLW